VALRWRMEQRPHRIRESWLMSMNPLDSAGVLAKVACAAQRLLDFRMRRVTTRGVITLRIWLQSWDPEDLWRSQHKEMAIGAPVGE
jgi:hypothetical protein